MEKRKMCEKCKNIGIIVTGNNDLPCDCPAGNKALFNQCGVKGPVTGAELRRHFFNGSPEPIEIGKGGMLASSLPGRILKKVRKAKVLMAALGINGVRFNLDLPTAEQVDKLLFILQELRVAKKSKNFSWFNL